MWLVVVGFMVLGAAATRANSLAPTARAGTTAQLEDDDLGGLDDFGDEDFLSDPGPGKGGDLLPEGPLDADPFPEDPFPDDPFPDDPFPEFPGPDSSSTGGPPVVSGLVPLDPLPADEVGACLTAFADLLDELRTRGLEQPFHEMALRRLETWVAFHSSSLGDFAEDPRGRLQELLQVARDPGRSLPPSEQRLLEEFRGGGAEPDWPGEFPGELDDDLGDLAWLDREVGGGHASSGGPGASLGAEDPANPFRIYRVRDRLAQRVFAPLDGVGWRAWLQRVAQDEAALQAGLAEVAGTAQGRQALTAALEAGIPTPAARLVATQLGEAGTSDDLDLLARLERLHPGARDAVQLARGRLQERVDRYQGLDARGREVAAGSLLTQAALMAEKGDLVRAARFAQEAIEVSPTPEGPMVRLAALAYPQGQFQKAREALESALARGASHWSVFTTYAKVLRQQGERDALIRFLERALDQGGATELKVRLCNELALEYSARGEADQAVRLARIGLGYYVPDEVRDNLLTRYAEGLTLQGKLAEAEAVFQRALALDPRYRKARTGLLAARTLRERQPRPPVAAPLPDPFPEPRLPTLTERPPAPDPFALDDDLFGGEDDLGDLEDF